jgi:hypothetical protein
VRWPPQAAEVRIFDWADADAEAAIATSVFDAEQTGSLATIEFAKDSNMRLIATGEKAVVFVSWTAAGELEWNMPLLTLAPSPAKVGAFVQSMSLPGSENVITTTAGGYVIVWRPEGDGVMGCEKTILLSPEVSDSSAPVEPELPPAESALPFAESSSYLLNCGPHVHSHPETSLNTRRVFPKHPLRHESSPNDLCRAR